MNFVLVYAFSGFTQPDFHSSFFDRILRVLILRGDRKHPSGPGEDLRGWNPPPLYAGNAGELL